MSFTLVKILNIADESRHANGLTLQKNIELTTEVSGESITSY
jgi:hypothetical protein